MDADNVDVTIVGVNYSPEVTGIAPYTTGFAEYLASEGLSAHVVTGFPHYPEWSISEENGKLPTRQVGKGVSIRRVRHYVPAVPTALRRIRMELSFGLRAISADWKHPAVVVSVSPSLIASGLVLIRARLSRSRPSVGIWVQDIYTRGVLETTEYAGLGARVARLVESRILRSADSVVVIHQRFADYLTNALGVPEEQIRVARNWAHITDLVARDPAESRRKLGWEWPGTLVLHAGNMGAKQGLENVVESARLAEKLGHPIQFVLLGHGNQRSALVELAGGISNIHFVDPLPDHLFSHALAAADILLVNEKVGVAEMAVPSKLTTYFSARKPVLAATESNSTTADEVEASGGGVVIAPGVPEDLIGAVLALGKDEEKCAQLADRGVQYKNGVLSPSECLGAHGAWIKALLGSNDSNRV